jgi:Ca2+-binding RTX toxin-like protein
MRVASYGGGGVKLVILSGTDLVPLATGGQLADLSGNQVTQIDAHGAGYQISLLFLTQSAPEFMELIKAQDWRGLADFIHQGDDYVLGSQNDDTLHGGDGDDYFRSNWGDDVVFGGAGNDSLEAQGNNDTLIGGKGADEFQFTDLPGQGQASWVKIKDFKSGTDRIAVLDYLANAGGVDGPVGAEHFHYGRAATTADHGLIYHKAKGLLYYDGDGSGALPQVLLAKLGAGTDLMLDDLWVI